MRPTSGPGPAALRQALPTSMPPTVNMRGRPSILRDSSGILQVDGYGGYAELAQRGDVALAFCWSHVRRQFYEIQVKTPAPIATEALVRIAALYAIEADIRGLAADERRQARQRRTKPLVDDLRLWLEAQLAAVSGKSTIAGAIRYALSRWEGLTRFLDDGRIEINSNVVERSGAAASLGFCAQTKACRTFLALATLCV